LTLLHLRTLAFSVALHLHHRVTRRTLRLEGTETADTVFQKMDVRWYQVICL
jgi:hypothetical protein